MIQMKSNRTIPTNLSRSLLIASLTFSLGAQIHTAQPTFAVSTAPPPQLAPAGQPSDMIASSATVSTTVYLPAIVKPDPVTLSDQTNIIETGRVAVYGMVVNNTSDPMYNVRLRITAYGSLGPGSLDFQPAISRVDPGKRAPYSFSASTQALGTVSSVVVRVVGYDSTSSTQLYPLVVTSVTPESSTVLRIIVRNTSAVTVLPIVAPVAISGTGQVVYVAQLNLSDVLAPGAELSFRLSTSAAALPNVTWIGFAEGAEANMARQSSGSEPRAFASPRQ